MLNLGVTLFEPKNQGEQQLVLSPRSSRRVKKSPSPSRFVLLLLYTRVMLGVQAGSLDVTPAVHLCFDPLDFEYPCGNMAL